VRRVWALAIAALACRPGGERAQAQGADTLGVMDTTDRHATMAAEHQMAMPMAADPHMKLTAARPLTAADSARGAALVAQMRTALARYRDVRVAQAEGFRQFLPGVVQPVYHFTNRLNAFAEMFRFDPARPTSLLYRKRPDGSFELVGVMYADRAGASEDELNARIPLALAHWHEHVNWCVPPVGARERWREVRDGHPVFGPKSPVATAEACTAVGGRFLPRIFGWMVHVNVFASDDPHIIWGAEHAHAPSPSP
jgi:hypothetical protein